MRSKPQIEGLVPFGRGKVLYCLAFSGAGASPNAVVYRVLRLERFLETAPADGTGDTDAPSSPLSQRIRGLVRCGEEVIRSGADAVPPLPAGSIVHPRFVQSIEEPGHRDSRQYHLRSEHGPPRESDASFVPHSPCRSTTIYRPDRKRSQHSTLSGQGRPLPHGEPSQIVSEAVRVRPC